MLELLIATSITCSEIEGLVARAKSYPDLTEHQRQEIIDLYQVDLVRDIGLKCNWDAKVD
tara:strand:- start:3854 stop:4033 length:180 start_codon:yes stop_codon:yes gene_type:complete